MKRTKRAKLLVLLACCLLLTGCPPSGGYLLPQAQEDAQVKTIVYWQDTLSVTRHQVSIDVRGVWSVADSATSVILEVNNRNAAPVKIDFARCEMVNSDSGDKLTLRSLSDETQGESSPAFLSERTVVINGGQMRRFALEFKMSSEDGRSSVSRDVLGQGTELRIPVRLEDESATEVDFIIAFKYADYRYRS
jgi:hypothetical protein